MEGHGARMLAAREAAHQGSPQAAATLLTWGLVGTGIVALHAGHARAAPGFVRQVRLKPAATSCPF